MAGTTERVLRLWETQKNCYWCNKPMTLEGRGTGGKDLLPNTATLEHLYSRKDKNRHKGQPCRVTLACHSCNNGRARFEALHNVVLPPDKKEAKKIIDGIIEFRNYWIQKEKEKTATYEQMENVVASCISKDLIKPKYRGEDNITGSCYIGAEAAYHLLGGKEKGFKPMVAKIDGLTHWWVVDKEGYKCEPTKTQFDSLEELNDYYSKGRGSGFLTKQPSNNAQILIERVKRIT